MWGLFLAPPPPPIVKIIAQPLPNAHTYEEHNFFQRLHFKVLVRVKKLRRLKYMFLHQHTIEWVRVK